MYICYHQYLRPTAHKIGNSIAFAYGDSLGVTDPRQGPNAHLQEVQVVEDSEEDVEDDEEDEDSSSEDVEEDEEDEDSSSEEEDGDASDVCVDLMCTTCIAKP